MIKSAFLIIICTLFYQCSRSDKKIELEKIIFHSSSCFGNCPVYHLELKNDKSFKLYAEQVFEKDAEPFSSDFDTSKIGYFTGQASDSSFQKLTNELTTIGLDTLNFEGPISTCGPDLMIIVYYNGKRNFFHSSTPTTKANKLISTLYEICRTSDAKRIESKFEIESEK